MEFVISRDWEYSHALVLVVLLDTIVKHEFIFVYKIQLIVIRVLARKHNLAVYVFT